MVIKEQKEKVARLVEELEEAQRQLEAMYATPEEIAMAEAIHSLICKYNHTDGCTWGYENWEEPGFARQKFLDFAKTAIDKGFDSDELEMAIKLIKEVTDICKFP